MKKRTYLPALLAMLMVLCVSVGSALAYFTTWTTSTANKSMNLRPKTSIEETLANDSQKKIKITNEGNEPCFIRVMVFANDSVTDLKIENEAITSGSYWYYTPVLEAGASVTLTITFTLPDNAEAGDRVNIAVVYESTPALYDPNTDSYYADWSLAAVTPPPEG